MIPAILTGFLERLNPFISFTPFWSGGSDPDLTCCDLTEFFHHFYKNSKKFWEKKLSNWCCQIWFREFWSRSYHGTSWWCPGWVRQCWLIQKHILSWKHTQKNTFTDKNSRYRVLPTFGFLNFCTKDTFHPVFSKVRVRARIVLHIGGGIRHILNALIYTFIFAFFQQLLSANIKGYEVSLMIFQFLTTIFLQ